MAVALPAITRARVHRIVKMRFMCTFLRFFVLSLDGVIIWKCFGTDPLSLGRHPGGHIVALLPILRPELLRGLLAQPVRIQVQNDLLDEQDI